MNVTPKRYPPDDPREWMNRAKSNLVLARNRLPDVYLEDLCFDAQQAAEKAIKAFSIHLDLCFPYTHDLTDLLTLVEGAGRKVPEDVKRAGILSDYAIESRYPGLAEPVTQEEYERAVSIAEKVVQWVERQMASGP
ncbi:HEPN domain-containing protein [Candidatus Bipolaricaulota bacterium]|nr:HEPN domain-containing protein [Candidatus Bipolaricaulota bacterium]